MGDPLSALLARATGLVGWSVAEIAEAGAIVVVGYGAAAAWIHVRRSGGLSGLGRWARRVALVAVGLAVSFYALWGHHYAEDALAVRVGWGQEMPEREALLRWGARLVGATNLAWRDVDPNGVASPWEAEREGRLERGLDAATRDVGLPDRARSSRGRVKPLRLSWPIVARLGISGFYFPWTGEANVVPGQPASATWHVIAHEKAHQRGVASEDEANFVGFLALLRSEDPNARAAAWLFAQRTVLRAALPHDADTVQALVAARSPAVQAEIDASRSFWQRFEGRSSAWGATVNDAYLRLHHVEGGARSYGLSVRLLVAWLDRFGESELPVGR